MTQINRVFIVLECTGCYDDYRERHLLAHVAKSEAEQHVAKLIDANEALAKRLQKLQDNADSDDGPQDENGYTAADRALEEFQEKHGYEAGDASYKIVEVKVKRAKG